eukprot:5333449-Pleurochrysis_carterae.AAC.2
MQGCTRTRRRVGKYQKSKKRAKGREESEREEKGEGKMRGRANPTARVEGGEIINPRVRGS